MANEAYKEAPRTHRSLMVNGASRDTADVAVSSGDTATKYFLDQFEGTDQVEAALRMGAVLGSLSLERSQVKYGKLAESLGMSFEELQAAYEGLQVLAEEVRTLSAFALPPEPATAEANN